MQAQLTINSCGVVTLPAKIRKAMGFQANDQLIAETTPQGLLLRPTVTLPLEMYTPERVHEFDAAEADLALLLLANRKHRSRSAYEFFLMRICFSLQPNQMVLSGNR